MRTIEVLPLIMCMTEGIPGVFMASEIKVSEVGEAQYPLVDVVPLEVTVISVVPPPCSP